MALASPADLAEAYRLSNGRGAVADLLGGGPHDVPTGTRPPTRAHSALHRHRSSSFTATNARCCWWTWLTVTTTPTDPSWSSRRAPTTSTSSTPGPRRRPCPGRIAPTRRPSVTRVEFVAAAPPQARRRRPPSRHLIYGHVYKSDLRSPRTTAAHSEGAVFLSLHETGGLLAQTVKA